MIKKREIERDNKNTILGIKLLSKNENNLNN